MQALRGAYFEELAGEPTQQTWKDVVVMTMQAQNTFHRLTDADSEAVATMRVEVAPFKGKLTGPDPIGTTSKSCSRSSTARSSSRSAARNASSRRV